ncbi:hypothetical protein DPMN_098396 [Dreissena polymorpha]|uniref:Uncharacterized protein n=1 Tax=Dreissena polymorpha TaxID=45954 RepID=A0A9D4R5G0_DREPO|nr:hypothetical protein DPMN_098396 [Dreissena polymorpha]
MCIRVHVETSRRNLGESPATEHAHPSSDFAHARRCGSALWRSWGEMFADYEGQCCSNSTHTSTLLHRNRVAGRELA